MKFPKAFLEELRARLPVSQVAGAKVALKRAGREFKGLSPFTKEKSPSFTVNDAKQFWHDFSSNKHGDIFGFVMETEGVTFPEAVERLAGLAGLALPKVSEEEEQASMRRASLRELVEEAARFYREALAGDGAGHARAYLRERGVDEPIRDRFLLGYAPAGGRALKDHLTAAGAALEDLEEAGLISIAEGSTAFRDRFIDRLIFPILDLRGRPVAFGARAMKADQQPKYLNSPEGPLFHKGAMLYNGPAARTAAYAGERLHVVEGYMDVVAMVSAGHVATVATLGTAVTAEQLAEVWRWTVEPVFCLDGDKAGEKAAARVIDLALPGLGDGRSVKFARMPEGVDPDKLLRTEGREALDAVLDDAVPLADALWRREIAGLEEADGDTPEQAAQFQKRLKAAVDTVKDAGVRSAYIRHYKAALAQYFGGHTVTAFDPIAAHSEFGRVRWQDQDHPPAGGEYEWWIKGILPKGQTVAVVGQSQTGKSYETLNMSMHIARGVDYRGCRTKQGLVVYCAFEGGKGFVDRLRAYRKFNEIGLDGVPFELLTRRADLFGSDTDTDKLIAEIRAIAAEHTHELAVVVLDTYSAATPGIKENHSEDISRVRQRILRIENALHCGVLMVDHTNAAGDKARGHTSKTADIEAQLEVSWVTHHEGKMLVRTKDDDGHEIRRLSVFKQREGKSGQHWDFVLLSRNVRVDADGDAVTACITTDPARSAEPVREEGRPGGKPGGDAKRGEGFRLKDSEATFFRALLKAIDMRGIAPPADVDRPPGVSRVVRWDDFTDVYKIEDPNDEAATPEGRNRYVERIKKALQRSRKTMQTYAVIGIGQTGGQDGHHVLWVTGKRVWGPNLQWPPIAKPRPAAAAPDDDGSDPMRDLLDEELPPP